LEFVLGILGFYIFDSCKNIKFKYSKYLTLISVLGFILLIYINKYCSFDNRFISFGLISFVVFISTIFGFKDIKINNKWLLVGKISYSFYFVEYFVSKFIKIVYSIFNRNFYLDVVFTIASILICVIVSYISYLLIEKRLTNKLLKLI
jgi:peptidoglycan/LPS O-acetylase OafA/YrhL